MMYTSSWIILIMFCYIYKLKVCQSKMDSTVEGSSGGRDHCRSSRAKLQ